MDVSKFLDISFLFFFLIIFPCASSLQFNLSTFGPDSINVTGAASFLNQEIHLTPYYRNMPILHRSGRAIYIEPLHLWNKPSGMLTNFSTSFSFLITSASETCFGDGMAFFLTPVGSKISERSGAGGALGLTNYSLDANPSSVDPIVAVEFDTNTNRYDPQGKKLPTHVGIDINSLRSVITTTWEKDLTEEVVNEAWITYDSLAKNLTVVFTASWDNRSWTDSLSYVVDLRAYLPEWTANGPSDQTTGTRKKLAAGLTSFLFLLALLGYGVCKQRNKKNEAPWLRLQITMDNEFEKGSGAKRFSYGELTKATSNFSDEEKLGEGGFGSVYRGC